MSYPRHMAQLSQPLARSADAGLPTPGLFSQAEIVSRQKMSVFTVRPFRGPMALFSGRIQQVIGLGAEEQVVRIAAPTIVALMTNQSGIVSVKAKPQNCCHALCRDPLFAAVSGTITRIVNWASPIPAARPVVHGQACDKRYLWPSGRPASTSAHEAILL